MGHSKAKTDLLRISLFQNMRMQNYLFNNWTIDKVVERIKTINTVNV